MTTAPEIIRSTAVALPASLVILGTVHSDSERRIAAQIADRVGSSVDSPRAVTERLAFGVIA